MKKLEVFKEDLERSSVRFATFWSLRLEIRESPESIVLHFLEEGCSESDTKSEKETDKKKRKKID